MFKNLTTQKKELLYYIRNIVILYISLYLLLLPFKQYQSSKLASLINYLEPEESITILVMFFMTALGFSAYNIATMSEKLKSDICGLIFFLCMCFSLLGPAISLLYIPHFICMGSRVCSDILKLMLTMLNSTPIPPVRWSQCINLLWIGIKIMVMTLRLLIIYTVFELLMHMFSRSSKISQNQN